MQEAVVALEEVEVAMEAELEEVTEHKSIWSHKLIFTFVVISIFLECYIRDRRGYKYYDRLIRDLISARDPEECSDECKRTNYCKSFGYR